MSFPNNLKHIFLKRLIIISGRIIELVFLKKIFKIIIDSKKFTTIADIFLDRLIRFWIFLLYPNKRVLSEENINQKNIGWIIDPLDGTRSYVNGFKGYVIQVCRVESGTVVESIIYSPAFNECFSFIYGDSLRKNHKVIDKPKFDKKGLIIIDNYPNPTGITKYLLDNIDFSTYLESGSLSMKALYVCLGLADIFVKDVTVRDWDVAPIIPFLSLRNCTMLDIEGNKYKLNPLSYEKKGLIVTPSPYIKKVLPIIKSFLDANVIL